jgi:methionyl-tRNA formyltransferase
MKIILIGVVEFSLSMLKTLLEQNVETVGVVTDRDRGVNADYAELEPICNEHGVPILFAKDINAAETVNWISNLSPDVIFCFGWSRLLKTEVLKLPPMGVVGYHPAELPKNRGRHPLIWALALGLNRTASTFFFMDEGADSGDILDQEVLAISDDDDAATLYAKIIEVAKVQVVRFLPLLNSGQYNRKPQDHSISNVWRKRGWRDGEIDWRMSATSIYNLIRALTLPYVGAHLSLGGQTHKVWKSEKIECGDLENVVPGQVLDVTEKGAVLVKCGEGAIALLDVEPPLNSSKGEHL